MPLYQLTLLILIPPASMTPGSSLTMTLKTAPSPMPTVTSSPVQVNHADYYSTSGKPSLVPLSSTSISFTSSRLYLLLPLPLLRLFSFFVFCSPLHIINSLNSTPSSTQPTPSTTPTYTNLLSYLFSPAKWNRFFVILSTAPSITLPAMSSKTRKQSFLTAAVLIAPALS